MRSILFVFTILALGTALAHADFNEADAVAAARADTAEFAKRLKSELLGAMESGGPLAAIGVCNVRAPQIAAAVSAKSGAAISRVSLKNRNPGNAPNEWQKAVLQDFEARKAQGEPASALEWHTVAETGSGRAFRFMKAIPTAPLCLQCHGQSIAPEVADRIAELYPEDKATGYQAGDIRGAFTVTSPAD